MAQLLVILGFIAAVGFVINRVAGTEKSQEFLRSGMGWCARYGVWCHPTPRVILILCQ